ncbi:hypothetical protein [Cohnella panacarvi]|uniref:hypothetical protein n=1 Tax=Cohnella panacarvi TaxID=400776 RepID=UPI00047E94F8|nr:hypothetical protein [Cohnella panacarvi]
MPYPAWMHIAFDGHFIERTIDAANLSETGTLRQRQKEVEEHLKRELTVADFQLILEWVEIMNYRATIEKEWFYYSGIKDGLSIWKHLLNHMPD